MSPDVKTPQIPYELRVPAGGMGQPHTPLSLLFWGLGCIMLGLAVSYLLVQGEFRLLLLVLLSVLGLMSLAPIRGIYILTLFLPFMYFLRRAVLNFQEFSPRDPILVFPAITTLAMSVGVIIFYGPRLLHYFRNSALLKVCTFLAGVMVLQIFNPLQGSLVVGLAGAMFFIVPMLWLLFGLILPREDMIRILKIILVLGCITALYGLYQRYFGLSEVEVYELKSKQFLKTFGSLSDVRVMSTFSGLSDFSRYLTVSTFIAFAYFWRTKNSVLMVLLVALQFFAMLYTAMRTSFLVTFFSMLMLMIVGGRNAKQVVARGMVALLVVCVLYSFTYRYDARNVYTSRMSSNPFVVHTLSGISHPTQESTFQVRLKIWAYVIGSTIWPYPVGRGLGSTTVAAKKFEGGDYYDTDSYFFELFYGSGLAAPILFMILVVMLLKRLTRLCLDWPDQYVYKICFGLVCGVLLSSVFGLTLRDNIIGPTAWLIIGWIIKEEIDTRRPMNLPDQAPSR